MASKRMRPPRFAHLEGHTNICYANNGNVITGGLDGDIRIFKNLDDDDCITHTVAEEIHCVAFHKENILAGTNMNMVQAYTLQEGSPNGIITRCTAFPTHIDISQDKKLIAVGSSDMTIKVHDSENYKDISFVGHESAILSVALDPQGDFLASSACDGTVRIWNFRTQTVVRIFSLFEKSNDFQLSNTLCRISWSRNGHYLFVPVDKEVHAYSRNTWKVDFKLHHSVIDKPISITSVSICGKYVATGCQDGRIAIWDVDTRHFLSSELPNKSVSITGMAWHPFSKEEIAYVNKDGEFGTYVDFLQDPDTAAATTVLEKDASMVDAPMETDSGDVPEFDANSLFGDGGANEDENEISLAKIKSQLGFADDEEGTFLGLPKPELSNPAADEHGRDIPTPLPAVVAPKLPEPQRPFQPSMSPEDLSDRYMLWNNTGIVRQCQTEEESSIEVEFHDSSVHHSLHLNNNAGYSMAALNSQALVLAAESQEDQMSVLQVHHFSSWDGNKEWQIEMEEGEDILAVTVGLDWIAVATDFRYLRIFSVAGVQRDVISLPGPVVCLAAFDKYITAIYHQGMGVSGEQNMAVLSLNVGGSRHLISPPQPLPLSPKSYLAWAGFSDEGTPVTVDSAGVIRLFNRSMGHAWSPVLNTKNHAKGKSDHYFVLGVSETQAEVRCVLCKGARFPPVLPRPHVSLLSFKIPLCGGENEKTGLEDKAMQTRIFSSTMDSLTRAGFDVQMAAQDANKNLKETMIKMLALAIRSDREARAVDVCELMPSAEMVQVAIKFAARMHRLGLAERLNDVAQKKADEEELLASRADDHPYGMEINGFGNRSMEYSQSSTGFGSNQSEDQMEDGQTESPLSDVHSNPLLAAAVKQKSRSEAVFGDRSRLSASTRNPFMKSSQLDAAPKGLTALDTLRLQTTESSSVLRPVFKGPKAKKKAADMSKLTKDTGKENVTNNTDTPKTDSSDVQPKQSAATTARKPSALKLWMEDNRETMSEKYPNATEPELLVKAAQMFKDVEDAVKQKYKEKAAHFNLSPVTSASDDNSAQPDPPAKRKSDGEGDTTSQAEKKSKTSSKLAGFAFKKAS